MDDSCISWSCCHIIVLVYAHLQYWLLVLTLLVDFFKTRQEVMIHQHNLLSYSGICLAEFWEQLIRMLGTDWWEWDEHALIFLVCGTLRRNYYFPRNKWNFKNCYKFLNLYYNYMKVTMFVALKKYQYLNMLVSPTSHSQTHTFEFWVFGSLTLDMIKENSNSTGHTKAFLNHFDNIINSNSGIQITKITLLRISNCR